MRASIKDIARAAGVSEATVSRVLNNKSWVKAETRDRVMNAIRAMNFQPNGLAQRLGRGNEHVGIIGVLIADSYGSFYDNYVFFEIIKGIGEIVDARGDSLLLSRVYEESGNRCERPGIMEQRLADGIIVGGIPVEESFFKQLVRYGIPVVAIGKYKTPAYRILVDNIGGGMKATEHLLKLGHRRIGIIVGPTEVYAFADKLTGYIQALQSYGIEADPGLIVEEKGEPFEGGYLGMKKLLSLKQTPTAVFISDMVMTAGAMKGLKEAGIKIPDGMAVVSYCGGGASYLFDIQLTTIAIGERNIGRAAARLLYDVIDGKVQRPMDITISTDLLIGESCGYRSKRT